jgi:ketosteroid isomerase-like protein
MSHCQHGWPVTGHDPGHALGSGAARRSVAADGGDRVEKVMRSTSLSSDVMDDERRNELIDAYFDGLDQDDFDALEEALAEDVVYLHPVREIHGSDAVADFAANERTPQDSEHVVERRIHDAEASVAAGRKVGEVTGEPVDVPFCDVFEFDDSSGAIASVSVYVRD